MATRLHATQKAAIDRAWREGLTVAQIKIVEALDCWFDENPTGPSIHEIMDLTGLAFGTIWTALPVLEHFGYAIVNRDRKGRVLRRGVILMHGFDLTKDA
jgi:hypothetical protein